METFHYNSAQSVDAAIQTAKQGSGSPVAKYIAGGTTLVDLMKLNVERPVQLVDINSLPLTQVEASSNGGLRIGAMVRNSDLAHHPAVVERYKVLSLALLSGASAQLRNMATTGGNLLQRTRCYYFRDTAYTECNKRIPGSGCAALHSFNRIHAVLGGSESCVATHPSDMAVAMMALEAVVVVKGSDGERKIPLYDFYHLPGTTPHIENALRPEELITYVDLPPLPPHTRSVYLKLRDRSSYEFALASAAAVVTLEGRKIRRARLAMGGVGVKPWRSLEAEKSLEGKEATPQSFREAAEVVFRRAKPLKDNAFKIPLGKRAVVRALTMATTEQA
jgi:xanthine dehydrogenase YagS FAD-binding subunit